MNRRDFLSPRHLAQATGQILGALDELQTLACAPPAQDITLLRVERRAMATSFEVLLPFGTPDALAAAEAALDVIDRMEDQLTVYRSESEVSRLNRLAPQEPVPVEDRLFDLLALAARITLETEGAYDITTGALIKAWGFYARQQRMPSARERTEVLTRVGMQHVVLDPGPRTVHYLRSGLEINLGSIGKGYALDRAAEELRNPWNLPAALLHGGHSSVYAIGSQPGDERGWAVGIRHPWDLERRLGTVHLRDRALATSAATFQHLNYAGRKLGHILDPRTGWPAEALASATVTAPTAAEADALATAFFILGLEKAAAYCNDHPAIGALLLPQGEAAVPVVLGLTAHEVDLASLPREKTS
jgi:thiamine biosynthesis lipoprotein